MWYNDSRGPSHKKGEKVSYSFTYVKEYKRGAKWKDGSPRMCTRCGYEGGRRKRAIFTAIIKYNNSKFTVPVGYCEDHAYRLGIMEGGEE